MCKKGKSLDSYEEMVELFFSAEQKLGKTRKREFEDNSVQLIFAKRGVRLREFIEEFNKKSWNDAIA